MPVLWAAMSASRKARPWRRRVAGLSLLSETNDEAEVKGVWETS